VVLRTRLAVLAMKVLLLHWNIEDAIGPAFGRGADLNFREQGAFGQLDGLKGDVHDAVLSKGGAVAAGAQPIVHGHPVMEDQPRDHWA